MIKGLRSFAAGVSRVRHDYDSGSLSPRAQAASAETEPAFTPDRLSMSKNLQERMGAQLSGRPRRIAVQAKAAFVPSQATLAELASRVETAVAPSGHRVSASHGGVPGEPTVTLLLQPAKTASSLQPSSLEQVVGALLDVTRSHAAQIRVAHREASHPGTTLFVAQNGAKLENAGVRAFHATPAAAADEWVLIDRADAPTSATE